MILTTAFTVLALGGQGTPSIDQLVQRNMHDLTFVAKVVKGDQAELRKINSDFGQSYRFTTTKVQYKEPLMLRSEAEVEDTQILFINNGPVQIIRIPRSHINSRQNLATKPGRRQSCLDFGILAPSLFEGFYIAHFVRWDRASGNAVFDLTFDPKLDTSRQRVWLDPQKKYVVKREWYNQPGRQLATFYYEDPKLVGGIWLPTRLTVRNVENIVAGVVAYSSVVVNTGLPDSLFE
jgi:outer membrane lipoprotein-sorting protein